MYETYLQNERVFEEKYACKACSGEGERDQGCEDCGQCIQICSECDGTGLEWEIENYEKIKSHNRLSLIRVMKALEKELAEGKKDFPLQHDLKGNCDFSYNQGLDVSLYKIRDFINKLEKEV